MFRHFTLAIFWLRNEKNLVSSYTRLIWVVYIGEVRGEVGTRSGMCCVGWVVWYMGSASIRGLLEKYPTFGREKETGLLGALDT